MRNPRGIKHHTPIRVEDLFSIPQACYSLPRRMVNEFHDLMLMHRAAAPSCLLGPSANECGGLAEKNGAEFLKGNRQCREIKRTATFLRQVAPIRKSKKPKSGINSRFVHLKPDNEPSKA